ncbi:MAG TPA: TetR/AcrR family transcriptional regulator [Syntrophorhabdaceae bacterium]|nr:TetR/AcrR family transcriptional regulator [Syntrophorhabdaceae bacterium]
MPVKNMFQELPESERKLSIATAAAQLFSSRGYIETSMEDIAAEGKMSKSLLYYYFKNKSEILYFVLTTFLNFVLANTREHLKGIEDPAEKLRRIIFGHVETYGEHMYLAKTLLNESNSLPSTKLKKIDSLEREYYHIISENISEYCGNQLDKDKLTAVTFTLLGMCNWIYAWYDPKGTIKPEQLSEIVFNIFVGQFWKDVRSGS